jgi:SpoIVB peptidase S55
VLRFVVPAIFALAFGLPAQTAFFPLRDVKAGQRGVGRTVFSGDRIEEFQVEILGVLDNIGPKQSLILARLSGGPLEHTGVMQGMSGSPVYIEGKLAGAVAMAFPFSKDPIAGIRPIQDMLGVADAPTGPAVQRSSIRLGDQDLTRALPRPEPALAGESRMVDIATPVSFGGFTRATLEHFAPQLRTFGLEPRQGVTGGGRIAPNMGNPADLKPGSMISVQLMAGDLSVGADGTVTHIDGGRVFAFGHRFLAVGTTALPFARAEVVTLLPNLNTSFKLSAAREWMGTILQDRSTAVTGVLGASAELVPVSIRLSRSGRQPEGYEMQMVNDRLLSPLLIQMAVFSAIDATERTLGAASFRITGEMDFQNAPAIRVNNMYASDNGSAALVSLSTAIPLAYVLQGGFASLQLKKVVLEIESFDEKKQLQIDQVAAARRDVRPGETVELSVALTGENGAETTRTVKWAVPIGIEPGPLYFTVADGNVTNLTEFRQIIGATARSPRQLISTVNNLRANTKAYVRVWRTDPAFQLEGEDFPDPPASVSLIFSGSQSALAGISQTRNSKLAEMDVDAGDMVVSGSKTIQVEVKE